MTEMSIESVRFGLILSYFSWGFLFKDNRKEKYLDVDSCAMFLFLPRMIVPQ